MSSKRNNTTSALIKVLAVITVLVIAGVMIDNYVFAGMFNYNLELVREVRYELQEVNSIEIDMDAGEVRIEKTNENMVVFREYADKNVWNEDDITLMNENKTLIVDENGNDFIINMVFGTQKEIVIYLPEKMYEYIDISLKSGKAYVSEIKAGSSVIEVKSGKMQIEDTELGKIDLSLSSGKIEAGGSFEKIDATVLSGKLEMYDFVAPDEMRLDVTSGNIDIEIPDNSGFTLDYKKSSGSVKSNFLDEKPEGSSGTAVYASGERIYEVSASSGSIKIDENN